MYQRSRIQEESLHYETLKHTGEFPIIGQYLPRQERFTHATPGAVIRAEATKRIPAGTVGRTIDGHAEASNAIDVEVRRHEGNNVFESLLVSANTAGQLSDALFEVGGAYRRNM